MTARTQRTALEVAREYYGRGWQPIPVAFKGKRAILPNWSRVRLSADDLEQHFLGERNIGVLLGEPSGGLVDVDLDHPVAVQLAPHFLGHTAVFGRPGNPNSHWLFFADGAPSQTYKDPMGRMLLEIRAGGHQTVFPGSVHESGDRIEWAGPERSPSAVEAQALTQAVGTLAAATLCVLSYPAKGSRSEFMLALAGLLIGRDATTESTEKFLEIVAQSAKDEEWRHRVKAVQQTANRKEADKPISGYRSLCGLIGVDTTRLIAGWLGLGDFELTDRTCTDTGNAERLVRGHGDDLRHVYAWKSWMVWNGKRWEKDEGALVMERATQTVRSIHGEAANALELKEQEALAKWAIASRGRKRLEDMISLARALRPTLPGVFDADPLLFNAHNGTIDLRTGTLRPFSRSDYLCKQSEVPYDSSALCPHWETFLDDVTRSDTDLQRFLQLWAGYCLTGDTSEQCFSVLFGTGANGKSVFIDVLRTLLGDYARPMAFQSLIDGHRAADARNDLAGLLGLRLVTAVESNPGKRFNESMIKEITGGDKITARFLYKEFFDFWPQFKLMLAVNHKPEIRGTDEGIWRRVRIVPFEQTIPEEKRIKGLNRRLIADEGPGILRWAVEGALLWQRDGLPMVEAVKEATSEYRRESDALRPFFEACCAIVNPTDQSVFVPFKTLYDTYCLWSREQGEEPWKARSFSTVLKERGFRSGARRHAGATAKGYYGLALNHSGESLRARYQHSGPGQPVETDDEEEKLPF